MSDALEHCREHWEEEMRGAFLYRALAASETSPPVRDLFARLAGESERQAAQWAARARERGERLPSSFVPDGRARVVAALARALGAHRIRPVLAAAKVRGLSALRAAPVTGHPMPTRVEEVGGRHRGGASAGNLRAAVFGASDGLVSNASLVLGIAGATPDPRTILLAGVAGLLAGAFSMASGEYVSVRTQREMMERQLATERDELATYPDAEAAELALIYEARGLPEDEARSVAARLVADPARALDTLAREELGVDPDELVSPWGAAAASFAAFASGAVLPVIPFLALPAGVATIACVALTTVALFGVGAITSLMTGAGALRSGARMVLVGGLAAGATWAVGRLLGVTLG